MISVGRNVIQYNDPLQEASIERVFKGLKKDSGKLAEQIKQLRILASIDAKKYREQKTKLPYIVCAKFNPRYRKKENFAYTEYFILDIDHIQEFDKDILEVKKKLKEDPRVHLLFTSPSGDGLKVFFKLKERINDRLYYTLFYKMFALEFAKKHDLEGMVDMVTSDVSRCCFMSVDASAFYRENPENIIDSEYTDNQNINSIGNLLSEIKTQDKANKIQKKERDIDLPKKEIELDILQQIKERINPTLKRKTANKNYVQPEQIDKIMDGFTSYFKEHHIELVEIEPISYGKKIKMKAQNIWAELNVFYGKRGFTIVETPKNGSNKELSGLCATIAKQYILKIENENFEKWQSLNP